VKDAFFSFFDRMTSRLHGDEQLTGHLSAEVSNFVRFNQGRVRQPGAVSQQDCTLRLINGRRQGSISLSLTGEVDEDLRRGSAALDQLRDWVSHISEDPHLCLPDTVRSSERLGDNRLPDPAQMVDDVLSSANGDDLVGILATGSIGRGFASSSGQKNWFTAHPFSMDWCLYHSGDKAVKNTYSGFSWDRGVLDNKMDSARSRLAILGQPTRKVEPGAYRAFLTPAAVGELVGLCCWGGFSAQATRLGMSPLFRLSSGDACLSPAITISENIAEGVTEDFQEGGFTRPPNTPLIENGKLVGTLCSPRTAVEHGLEGNGASGHESPCALDMAPGNLPESEILERLGTGIYVSNLWYLNFSDRSAGRMTGMTRFATLWVENGKAVAPVDPMRFDESIYRTLGENLIDLTQEREFDLSTSTYEQRSTNSTRVPGALVKDFTFTL
jgi:predicted Zn-dependent protease